ncbi:MAG TPA: cell division protein FtsL [Burkholderiales bacterium]|nr:cell division protein FtsL [Burkholderiales bacterium]
MIKLNIVLSVFLVLCALALVTSQHKARKLFTELTREQEAAKQIDVEWGQLQLEQSTWAMHARIEKIASGYLQMSVPAAKRVRMVTTESPAADARRTEITKTQR